MLAFNFNTATASERISLENKKQKLYLLPDADMIKNQILENCLSGFHGRVEDFLEKTKMHESLGN